jgi:hypothetical protein
MAITYMLSREVELAVQKESSYGTSPGAIAGTDFFKHKSRLHITPVRAEYRRNQDAAYQNASVIGRQAGRESSDVRVDCDLIPSGNATVITAPDVDVLLEAVMGTKHAATAHTVTVAGSAGTNLKLAVGGVAATGVAVGDLVAVDVDATFGYEVRRVVALVGGGTPDDITLNAALSANPAVGRTVKLGTTYKLLSTASISTYLWQWIAGTEARHVVPGCVWQQLALACEFANETPVATIGFTGKGARETTHATARPTPSTAGVPLLAAEGKFFAGASLHRLLSAGLTVNSLTDLRNNESTSLVPTGVKNTNNDSRWLVEASIRALLTTGDRDTAALYNTQNATTPASIDAIVQLGTSPGSIVAWAMPKWHARPVRSEQDGEFAVDFAGTADGTTLDDEAFLAFL